MVYKSGKLMLMGSPNTVLTDMDECQRFGHTTLRRYARIIQSKIECGQLLNVKLETFTATYDFGFQIKFSELYKNIVGSYEPEIFPGFMIKRHNIDWMYLLVGKMVCVGLKNIRWCYNYCIFTNFWNWIIYVHDEWIKYDVFKKIVFSRGLRLTLPFLRNQ